MTLSVGAATDFIVAKARQAVATTTVHGQSVLVVDGWPDELSFGMFVVGVTRPPPEIEGDTYGTRSWASLGAQRLEEDYTIPCYVSVTIGNGTQKQARDQAAAIFDSWWSLMRTDLTLGGVLRSRGPAEVTDLTFTPARVGTEAEAGRRQVIAFGVHCRNVTN